MPMILTRYKTCVAVNDSNASGKLKVTNGLTGPVSGQKNLTCPVTGPGRVGTVTGFNGLDCSAFKLNHAGYGL